MSSAIKWKSTITTAVFKNWTEHMFSNATFVTEFDFYKKGYLEHENLQRKKVKGRPKAELKDFL